MKQIINSILDNDLYKFTMQQIVFHQYANCDVEYQFTCRNKDIKLGFLCEKVKEQISALKHVSLKNDEYDYLVYVLPQFFKKDYCDFLKDFVFDTNTVDVRDVDGDLSISICGKWLDTILYEVPILAIVNELYFEHERQQLSMSIEDVQKIGYENLFKKCCLVEGMPNIDIIEFGTRRRFSAEWQKRVVEYMKSYINFNNLKGTSNLLLAKTYDLKPFGTMAHEYISAHMGIVPRTNDLRQDLSLAQRRALYVWVQEYGSNLGIALSDTFTSEMFFMDFDKHLSNIYSGVRHDSGNPYAFGKKCIRHYERLGIDACTKHSVFSDSLNFPSIINIFNTFAGKIKMSFGMGTNLTNDVGMDALNIVIKLIKCNGIDCIKLSDVISKAVGKQEIINDFVGNFQSVI